MKKFFFCVSLVLTGLMTSCVEKYEDPASTGPLLENTPEVVTWLEHRPPVISHVQGEPVHTHFDVCASGHCQRYIGLTPAADSQARAVIDETWGKV